MPVNAEYIGTDDENTTQLPTLKAFLSKTPAEVGDYVQNKIVDAGTSKEVSKDLAMLLSVAMREIKILREKIK